MMIGATAPMATSGVTDNRKRDWRVVFYDFSELRVVARSSSDAETLARAEMIRRDLPSSVRRVEEWNDRA